MRVFALVMFLVATGFAVGFGPRTPLSVVLFLIDPAVPSTLQSVVQHTLPNWFWDPLAIELLSWPSWIFPVVFGLFSLLLTIGRPGRRG